MVSIQDVKTDDGTGVLTFACFLFSGFCWPRGSAQKYKQYFWYANYTEHDSDVHDQREVRGS